MTATKAMHNLARVGKVPIGLALAFGTILLLYSGSHTLIWSLALVGCMLAFWEINLLLKCSQRQSLISACAVGVACLLCKWLLSSSREAVNEFLLLALLIWILLAPLWLARRALLPRAIMTALWGFTIVSAWLSLAVLAEYDRWMLIAGLAGVWLIDTGAWATGKLFGTRRLAAKISPNKTWEGVFGAMIVAFLFVSVVWEIFLSESYPHWLILVIAATVVALAVLGDLVASVLKRQAKVKDSGFLLGTQGGILDRIDSWLPVLPFLALLSTLV